MSSSWDCALERYCTKARGRTIGLTCRSDFGDKARSFLDTVADLLAKGDGPGEPGSTLFFGGLPFRILEKGDEYEIRQPDYGADNPMSTWTENVSPAIVLVTAQCHIARLIGVPPYDYRIDQSFVALKEATSHSTFYMLRQEPSDDESGWYLGSADRSPEDPCPSDYGIAPLHALFQLRPAALQAVALPPGYLARFEDNVLVRVVNEKDEEVYHHHRNAVH